MRINPVSTALAAGLILCACTFGQMPIPLKNSSGVINSTATVVSMDIVCDTESTEASDAYNNAKNLADAGRFDDAEAEYLKAIELDPEFCDAMDNLGVMLRRQGRLDEAIEWYTKSLDVNPDNVVAIQNLGVAYRLAEEYDKAVDTYQMLIDLDPENAEGYFGLGSTYYEMNDPEKAVENFEKAEQIYQKTGSLYLIDAEYGLGVSYFDLNDCINTRKYLEPIYTESDARMNYALGVCYATTEPKDLELARKYIARVEALGGTIPDDIRQALEGE